MRPSQTIHLPTYSEITSPRIPKQQARPRRLRAVQCVGGSRSVLVLDATNILSRASADRQRWQHVPGQSLQGAFQAWLAFLQLLAADALLVAVFDEPKVRGPGNLKVAWIGCLNTRPVPARLCRLSGKARGSGAAPRQTI